MRWLRLVAFVGLLATVGLLPWWATAWSEEPVPKPTTPPQPTFVQDVRPLLKTYCFDCHNPSRRKGGLDLAEIETDAAAAGRDDLWDSVAERMRAKEMPPPKSKQLTADEQRVLTEWLKHAAESRVDYDKLTKEQREELLAGEPFSRRLNRVEYGNTLRDLFGINLHAGDLLPSEGGGGEGFDNAGATLFTTPVLVEKYLEAAELVLGALLPAGKKADPKFDAARRSLLIAVPDAKTSPRDAARTVLTAFLPRAFRRPATDKEIDRFLDVFEKAHARGDGYEPALKLALKGVLISPHFLFLTETPAEKTGTYPLDQYEVAAHLSYFLWASMPDETLIGLAAKGKLHDPAILREQVRRMVRDPKSRGFAESFGGQWLGIRPLGTTVRPDAKAFPEFDDELAATMREETVLFLDTIIREDRSVLDVIDADYTFVNERLAALYKIDGVKGSEMRRVKLTDPNRGGVLGHAGILAVTSFPHRTSPVLRGRWVLEELLGVEVPPPPPDVPVLNDRPKGADASLTFRQMLEKHRNKSECAACHARMDPLGFGLENFDAIGRWRTEQGGQPVDSAGVLPTGEKFSGPAELKKLLLEKRRAEFLRNVCRKALGYALGREIKRVDLSVVQDCVKSLEACEFHSSRLLETIVLSYPFTHRNQMK
ncbi:DUF1592 domain-containing protein [Limnoglobus roseus]|uniref:DUF1592 domain-containing protein n=1 Tax=Limnoglobus roseus TaxID=2598579 RepID=A0A5C1A544_9BACT|nr:DUF1592 domain-containing protein [Limnoglobus roseus]QEL13463.1 hypothetical protein PX52LOC_00320 [Limnoglobus roseus]